MEENMSNKMNTEVSPESNDHEMQAKQGDLTHSLRAVYRLTEQCKSFCYYFRNEWEPERNKRPRDYKEVRERLRGIRSGLIKRRLREKTNPIIDGEKHKKEPVAAVSKKEPVAAVSKEEPIAAVTKKEHFANILRASELEQYIYSAIAVFLDDHLEGANLYSIYSYAKRRYKYVTLGDVEYVLKKYPRSFEEFVPTYAPRIFKKRKPVSINRKALA